MFNLVIFGIYAFIVLIVLGFLSIFIVHIKNFREYSRFLTPVLRVYITLLAIIIVFGGYMILTSKAPVTKTVKAESLDF